MEAMDNGTKVTATITKEQSNGDSVTTRVEKVENGYIITIDTYQRSVYENDKCIKDSKYETKKYISSKNPLEQETEEIEEVSLAQLLLNA
jgi:aconitase B